MPVMDIQRSFMFVPGSSEKMLTKAMGLDNLDVAMFDLVDGVLTEREPRAGLAPGSVRVIAAIESARGLLNAPALAAGSPRMMGLMFGAEDFGLDIGLSTNRQGEGRELVYARSAVIIAAAATKVQAIDGVLPDIR